MFWIPERKEEIMEKIEIDDELNKSYHSWDGALFHRLRDDPFKLYDEMPKECIPDKQKVYLEIINSDGSLIPLNFDICAGDYRTKSERYYIFEGSEGKCKINMLHHTITEFTSYYDNDKNNDSHGGADYYIMETFVKLMLNHNADNLVTFIEALRATHIGCLAERSLENNGSTELYVET